MSSDSFDRKDAHLKRLRDFLGDDPKRSSLHSITADNEVAWETGTFDDEKKPDSEYSYGLLVRARRDALRAVLNSSEVLDAIPGLRTTLDNNARELRTISTLCGIAVALLGLITWKVVF